MTKIIISIECVYNFSFLTKEKTFISIADSTPNLFILALDLTSTSHRKFFINILNKQFYRLNFSMKNR